MGYLFLSISLLSGTIKGYCGKRTSGYVTRFSDALLINLIRMTLCILIGFGVLWVGGGISQLSVGGSTLVITALSGITTAVFVTSWLLSVRKGAYMLVNVFLMVGVFITILCSYSLGEHVTLRQGIGLVLLLIAVFLMCSYQNATKGKLTLLAIFLLILCGVSNGLTDFSQKLFVRNVVGSSIAVFQFYTYAFAAVTLLIIYLCASLLEKRSLPAQATETQPPQKMPLAMVGFVTIMAIFLYLNSYFKTQSAEYLIASQLYPLYQGGDLILSTAMAAILFKEKPTVTGIVGIAIAFAALLLINL